MVTAPRPTVVVAGDRRSWDRHWSDAAGEVLDAFADRIDVFLDPDAPVEEREAQVDGALAGANALLLCGWGDQCIGYLSATRLAEAPRLGYIGTTCHYHQAEFVEMPAAQARGVAFSDTSPVMSPWVAEYELALGLAALRRLPQEHELVGAGGWVEFPDTPDRPDRLHGRRVGLASFGEIHRHLAHFLAPFETEWEAYDPFVSADRIASAGGRKVDDLTAMARRSEVFFVAIPPTPQTIEIIDRDVLYALPRDAVFVLVSRMVVVDQTPLLERLVAGELRAAIDVYDPEPPPLDSALRSLPNVIHTPHRAGNTHGAHRGIFRAQCEEARRHFAGEELRFPLRPELIELFGRARPQ